MIELTKHDIRLIAAAIRAYSSELIKANLHINPLSDLYRNRDRDIDSLETIHDKFCDHVFETLPDGTQICFECDYVLSELKEMVIKLSSELEQSKTETAQRDKDCESILKSPNIRSN